MGESERVIESVAGPPTTPVSVEEFKATLGNLAAGVSVVTACDEDGSDVAMTATALISVSLEPPLVLVSVGEGSRMYDVLEVQDEWAASLLNEDQAHVSGRFAVRGRVNDRLLFEDLPRHRGRATGAYVLDDALVAIECRIIRRVPAGDHVLMISEVLATEQLSPGRPPLLHFSGRYRGLHGGRGGRL